MPCFRVLKKILGPGHVHPFANLELKERMDDNRCHADDLFALKRGKFYYIFYPRCHLELIIILFFADKDVFFRVKHQDFRTLESSQTSE